MNVPVVPRLNNFFMSQPAQQSHSSTDLSVLSDASASSVVKDAALRYQLDQLVKQNESQYIITSVQVTDMQTGHTVYSHDADTSQFAASLNKIPIAFLLLQDLRSGKVHLTDTINWDSSDVRDGYGTYDQPGAPMTATVQQLIQDMLNRSGNTAVRALVNKTSLGGPMAVNMRLAEYPKLIQTRLQLLSPTSFYLGNTTASEGTWLMQQVQKNKDTYEKTMQDAMATNIFTDYGVRSQLAGNNYIQLVNKVGILDDNDAGTNRHDEGIIYNTNTHRSYAYSLMTTNFAQDYSLDGPAEKSLQDMGLVILRFAGDKPIQANKSQAQNIVPGFQESPVLDKKILY